MQVNWTILKHLASHNSLSSTHPLRGQRTWPCNGLTPKVGPSMNLYNGDYYEIGAVRISRLVL
jgi:hypothetical protein